MERERLLLVTVGLPARGKSYISCKLRGFLRWRGVSCESFNVGQARRKAATAAQTAEFFSANNEAAKAQRERLAMETLHGALDWLEGSTNPSGAVAILDATNTTVERRRHVLQSVADYYGDKSRCPVVVFMECICNDPATLQSNMRQKCANSPDYAGMSIEDAMADLARRVAEYEKVYEPIDEAREDELSALGPISYIKLIDLQSKVVRVARASPLCASAVWWHNRPRRAFKLYS